MPRLDVLAADLQLGRPSAATANPQQRERHRNGRRINAPEDRRPGAQQHGPRRRGSRSLTPMRALRTTDHGNTYEVPPQSERR